MEFFHYSVNNCLLNEHDVLGTTKEYRQEKVDQIPDVIEQNLCSHR